MNKLSFFDPIIGKHLALISTGRIEEGGNVVYAPSAGIPGMIQNVAVAIESTNQSLAVGATKASATVTIVDYANLHFTAATPSGTITFGSPSDGDTIIFTGLPNDGTKTFTKVASSPGADEFSSIAELTALIQALTDLNASDNGTVVTITVATKGTAMNSATITGTGSYAALSRTFSGGIDAAVLTIAGHVLTESTDWNAETSNDVTADNLAAAIDALSEVSAANPAAAVITIESAIAGYTGNTYGLESSDETNMSISGDTLSGGLYLFTGNLAPAPILNSAGTLQGSPSFSGSTFLNEKSNEDDVTSSGDYFVDYTNGRYKVWTPDGQTSSVTATWNIAKLVVDVQLNAESIVVDFSTNADPAKCPTMKNSTALEASNIVKSSAGVLHSLIVYNDKNSDQYVLLFNSTTVPADGTVPFVVPIPVPAKSVASINFGQNGIAFSTGIVVCNSSTPGTKTLGSADCFFTVAYK